jgi:hypothetical protein
MSHSYHENNSVTAFAGIASNPNNPACGNGIAIHDACLTRENTQCAAIIVRGSGGTSNYNALNVKYQAHNLHNSGFDLIANYHWAHSLDDLSSTFSDSSQGGTGYIGNLDGIRSKASRRRGSFLVEDQNSLDRGEAFYENCRM